MTLPNAIITEEQSSEIFRWWVSRGGFAAHPKHDALKCLEEVIELCIASGASEAELKDVLNVELHKARERRELGIVDFEKIQEEYGDSITCLHLVAQKWVTDPCGKVNKTLEKIQERQWTVNSKTGILFRPRSINETDVPTEPAMSVETVAVVDTNTNTK